MINVNVLKHIMNLGISDRAYFQVNAIANKALKDLAANMDANNIYGAQYKMMIDNYFKSPDKFKLNNAPKIPDGSPIGSDYCNFNTID